MRCVNLLLERPCSFFGLLRIRLPNLPLIRSAGENVIGSSFRSKKLIFVFENLLNIRGKGCDTSQTVMHDAIAEKIVEKLKNWKKNFLNSSTRYKGEHNVHWIMGWHQPCVYHVCVCIENIHVFFCACFFFVCENVLHGRGTVGIWGVTVCAKQPNWLATHALFIRFKCKMSTQRSYLAAIRPLILFVI